MTLPRLRKKNRFDPPQFVKNLLMTLPSEAPANPPPPPPNKKRTFPKGFEPGSDIVRVRVVLKRTVVDDSD